MSFSFTVNGHAGPNVEANDADEGERVKRFASAVLTAGVAEGLNVSVRSFSPPQWTPETTDANVEG